MENWLSSLLLGPRDNTKQPNTIEAENKDPGLRIFEHDAALSWFAKLMRSESDELLSNTLELQRGSYIEVDQGMAIICAAQVVGALITKRSGNLPPAVRTWIRRHSDLDVTGLLDLGLDALDSVTGEKSELHYAFVDDDDRTVWERQIQSLRDELASLRS